MSVFRTDTSKAAELRRELHSQPELSGAEVRTAARLRDFLASCGPTEIIEGIGGCGLAAIFAFNNPGPTLLVRCELDALPIQEVNDFEHRSKVDGVSHKCGHDGHMAIVAALAQNLSESPPPSGRVVLLFQPAEEIGAGAAAVLNDEKFTRLKIDCAIALHNLPGAPKHGIVCRTGSFSAAVKTAIIALRGKTSHAGEPELGLNPAAAIADIIRQTRALERPADGEDFTLVTPVHISMGEKAHGISAGEGEMRFTLRAWDNARLAAAEDAVRTIVNKAAEAHSLQYSIDWTDHFAATNNNADSVQLVKRAAEHLGLSYTDKAEAFRWGEDFGLFTERFAGAMFGLGAGEDTPPLHNAAYDFPDELIPTGAGMFRSVIDQLLQET